MSATLDASVTVNPMIVARAMERGAVLMNTMNGDCFELNAVGAAVWDHIGRGSTLPTLIAAIARVYEVERATVTSDVLRLIDDLARQGIVILAAK